MNTALNEKIATEVMGYQFLTPPGMVSPHWYRTWPSGYIDVCFDGLPSYSEYMDAAWKVVEVLQARGIILECLSFLRSAWYCNFENFEQDTPPVWGMAERQPSPSMAICHAALDIMTKLGGIT